MVTNGNEKMPKNAEIFFCKLCDFKCCKYSNYIAHVNTRKHTNGNKMVTYDNHFLPKNAEYTCKCGNIYKHKSGLSRHKKICNNIDNSNTEKSTIEKSTNDKDIIMMLIKEHSEIKSLIMEVIKNGMINNSNNTTNTNSHNKAFNLQFFLNETCKNAMNIMDFADSIQLQLSDLENVGQAGYVEGISNIIVKNLKALDITERPIHCTDKKRETMYIKDEDKWEKEDDDKKIIKKVIKKVACKNQRLLMKYKEEHPGCNYSESKFSVQYSKLVIEAMGGAGNNDEEKETKIIKNITKEVILDKNITKNDTNN
jgi:hypothetical protein